MSRTRWFDSAAITFAVAIVIVLALITHRPRPPCNTRARSDR